MRLKFDNNPLGVRKNNYTTKIVNAIIYDLDTWPKNLTNMSVSGQNKAQYNLYRQIAKISALPSDVSKYESLTGKGVSQEKKKAFSSRIVCLAQQL